MNQPMNLTKKRELLRAGKKSKMQQHLSLNVRYKQKPQEWNDYLTDNDKFKLPANEIIRRKYLLVSKHNILAKDIFPRKMPPSSQSYYEDGKDAQSTDLGENALDLVANSDRNKKYRRIKFSDSAVKEDSLNLDKNDTADIDEENDEVEGDSSRAEKKKSQGFGEGKILSHVRDQRWRFIKTSSRNIKKSKAAKPSVSTFGHNSSCRRVPVNHATAVCNAPFSWTRRGTTTLNAISENEGGGAYDCYNEGDDEDTVKYHNNRAYQRPAYRQNRHVLSTRHHSNSHTAPPRRRADLLFTNGDSKTSAKPAWGDAQSGSIKSKAVGFPNSYNSDKSNNRSTASPAEDWETYQQMGAEIKNLLEELRYFERLSGKRSFFDSEEIEIALDSMVGAVPISAGSEVDEADLTTTAPSLSVPMIMKFLVHLVCQSLTYLLHSEVEIASHKSNYATLSAKVDTLSESLQNSVGYANFDLFRHKLAETGNAGATEKNILPSSPITTIPRRYYDPDITRSALVDGDDNNENVMLNKMTGSAASDWLFTAGNAAGVGSSSIAVDSPSVVTPAKYTVKIALSVPTPTSTGTTAATSASSSTLDQFVEPKILFPTDEFTSIPRLAITAVREKRSDEEFSSSKNNFLPETPTTSTTTTTPAASPWSPSPSLPLSTMMQGPGQSGTPIVHGPPESTSTNNNNNIPASLKGRVSVGKESNSFVISVPQTLSLSPHGKPQHPFSHASSQLYNNQRQPQKNVHFDILSSYPNESLSTASTEDFNGVKSTKSTSRLSTLTAKMHAPVPIVSHDPSKKIVHHSSTSPLPYALPQEPELSSLPSPLKDGFANDIAYWSAAATAESSKPVAADKPDGGRISKVVSPFHATPSNSIMSGVRIAHGAQKLVFDARYGSF